MVKNETFACNPNNWVDEYADEFFRFTMYRIKNREVAEDLVQDTFLSALNSLDKFRCDCPEKSWLYNILRNKIIDYYRKKGSHEIKNSGTEDKDEDAFYTNYFKNEGESGGEWIDDKAPGNWGISADHIMEREEFMQFLMLCLSLLPETWAKVFSLKNIDDLSTEDICKELNLTPSNLWTIIHRAKLQLRSCLEKRWLEK